MALNSIRPAYDLRLFDPEKPNLLFSSNIPAKIAACVAEMHLFAGGTTSRLVELAPSIATFDLVLELNAVVTRDPSLGPSQLVRRNQVFVAKSGARASGLASGKSEPHSRGQNCFPSAPEFWSAVLAKNNDLFVVSTHLVVESLTVDLADPTQVQIEFDHASAELVTHAGVIGTIKAYIQRKLVAELRNNSNLPSDISNSLTILQELPVAEHAPMRRFPPLRSASALFDTSLDEFGHKLLVFEDDFDVSGDEVRVLHSDDSGKCTAEEDDDSFDARVPFLQEPIELGFKESNGNTEADAETRASTGAQARVITDLATNRDTSNGFNTSDTSNSKDIPTGLSISDDSSTTDGLSTDTLNILNTTNSTDSADPPSYASKRRFTATSSVTNISSTKDSKPNGDTNASDAQDNREGDMASQPLRQPLSDTLASHIPMSESLRQSSDNTLTDQRESPTTARHLHIDLSYNQPSTDNLHIESTDSISTHMSIPTPVSPRSHVETSTQANSPITHVAESHFEKIPPLQPSFTGEFTPIPSGSPIRLPLRVNHDTLPRGGGKSSFSMITTEDNFGLEYAFRDKSSEVPSFIKQDKKFKFIKVGKVQKFVHMFEEKVEEPSSNVGSRNPTRPASPFK